MKLLQICGENCDSLAKSFQARQEKQVMVNEFIEIQFNEQRKDEKVQDEKIERLETGLTEIDPEGKEIKEIKSQIAMMSTNLNSIKSEMNDVLAAKKELCHTSATTQPQVYQDRHAFPSVHDICNELQQRERKQQNLVVFGLTESSTDGETIQQFVSDIGACSRVNSSFRIGKEVEGQARPLVIHFWTKQERNDVFANLKNLKGQVKWNKISVSPDLTKIQCAEEKQIYNLLLKEAQEKNEAIDVGKGFWKVIGGRGNKRIVFSKQ